MTPIENDHPAPVPVTLRGWPAVEAWVDTHFWVPVLAVFLVSLLARIFTALPTALNPDEAMHVTLTNYPSLWQMYLHDLEGPDPSLMHVILFPLVKLFASDFVLRLPLVLAGSFAVLFTYQWLKELFGRTIGLVGMIIMAFAPAAIFFSAEIRAYALVIFFSVSALYCFEAGVRRDSSLLMLLFGACQCLALASQYSAVFILFAAGIYSLYVVLHSRIRGRLLGAWLAAEGVTVGLLAFLYVTHLSKLHGSQVESLMKGGFLSRAYFNPAKDTVLSFVATRVVAAFGFLFTSRYIGYVALALFLASLVLLLARGAARDGGPSRREVSLLLVTPWLVAALGGLLGLYPFAGMRHILLLIVVAVAGVAFMLGKIAGRRPALVLVAALVLVPPWYITRHIYAAGWAIDAGPSNRSYITQAVAYVREQLPDGGIVFSDLESHHVFRRYLFRGNAGTGRTAPARYYEYDWNGYRMVTLKYWKVKPESLGDEVHHVAEAYGLEPGTKVCVVSGGWGTSLARYLRLRGVVYPGAREFSSNIAVLAIPVGTEVMTDSLSRRVAQTRGALYSLASNLARVARWRAEMVVWPSYYLDSTAQAVTADLAPQTMSYRMFYELASNGQLPLDALLPGLTFWVFGTEEPHADYMGYMEGGQSYIVAGHRFALLGTDPDRLTAVYLIEPSESTP